MTKTLFSIVALLLAMTITAQTPTVLTLKASGVSSTEIPEGSSHISISAALKGAVNANGTNCTVSFEYGLTTSYGNTIDASPGTVTGSVDNAINAAVTLNYTHIGQEDRIIHYRLKVVNENGTYYGRDFVATPMDITRNIGTFGQCSDSPTIIFFDVMNNNSTDITLQYTDNQGTSGSVIVGTHQTQQIAIHKNSVCSFNFHYTLFRQVLTNDQLCSETPLLRQKVFMTATGRIASDKLIYRIENVNSSSVNIEMTCGSSIYSYTIAPQSVAYFAGHLAEAQISISGEPFAISSPTTYTYEGMFWLSVTPLTSTVSTANFELYNRDDAAHAFVLRNNGGTENSYTLAAYESRTITLANENWDVFTNVWDPTGPPWGCIYTGPAFGDANYTHNGMIKVATAVPTAVSSLTPILTSLTANSSTSFTANGVIAGNPSQSETVDYYFIYGTDPNNLSQSTTTQQVIIPAGQDANVNATISGLTTDNLYYCNLVAGSIQSNRKEIFVSMLPTSNLKMRLRADINVTTSSSLVSNWGDVSGLDNDATQTNSVNQPTWVDNQINEKPTIRFNGTSSKMSLPTSSDLGIQNNPYEIFVVGKSSSSNVQFLIAGGALEQFEYHLNGVGARFIPTTSVYLDKGTAGNYTDANAHIFSARASSSGGAVRVDGVDGGTSSSNILSSNSGNLLLGVRSDGTYYFNGDIAEVIIYDTTLTIAQRDSVELYLYNRYFTKSITAVANPINSGTISGTGNYPINDIATLTATSHTGYSFVNWTQNGNEVSTNMSYSVTVTQDSNFVANFAISTFTLTYLADVNGTLSGIATQSINYGNDGTAITAIPNTGYHFVDWSDGSIQNPRTDTNVTANISVTANFGFTTSIKENIVNGRVIVYPNPVSDELIIEIKGNNEKTNFDILNNIGQVVFKGNLVEKTTIQTGNFANGVYLLRLSDGKTFEIKKIIKE